MADETIRRLVEATASLKLDGGGARRRHHPLAPGVARDKTYDHPGGRVALPAKGAGFDSIKGSLETTVLDLDDAVSTAIWIRLFGHPALVMARGGTSSEGLLAQEIAVPDARIPDVRQWALASVVEIPEPSVGQMLPGRRIAVTANLTMLLEPTGRLVEEAWVAQQWHQSASEFGFWLAEQYQGVSEDRRNRAAARSVGLLLRQSDDRRTRVQVDDNVFACAAAFGLRLRVFELTGSDHGRIAQDMSREPPSVLIIAGVMDGPLRAILAAYDQAATSKRVLRLGPFSGQTLHLRLAGAFAAISGVSPDLRPLDWEPEEEEQEERPRVPVVDPQECLHDDSERFYLLDGHTGLWWTVDTAGHGGSTFKTYRAEGAFLAHEADRDPSGKPIKKHKGERGRRVDKNSLHGCPDPIRHVR